MWQLVLTKIVPKPVCGVLHQVGMGPTEWCALPLDSKRVIRDQMEILLADLSGYPTYPELVSRRWFFRVRNELRAGHKKTKGDRVGLVAL
jgi:hypothetical protein